MNGQMEHKVHEFCVRMRKEMNILGVKEVESFDDTCVILHTQGGEMTIEGKDLRVGTLDVEHGVVILSGRIDAVYYSNDQAEKKRGLFGKILR